MSVITFTPISGCGEGDPLCYLLTIDDSNILLDCGCTSDFQIDHLDALAAVVPTLDAILLSHPDVSHIGALPHVVAKMGLPASCNIYATIPVCKLGQMFLYDAYQAHQLQWDQELTDAAEEKGLSPYLPKEELRQLLAADGAPTRSFDVLHLDDVDDAFDDSPDGALSPAGGCVMVRSGGRMRSLCFSEMVHLTGNAAGITIMPVEAGHTVGGAIWRICKEAEQIVYAANFNHKTERHLNAARLELCANPTHFITTAPCAGGKSSKEWEKQLMSKVVSTLRDGGNVLLPTDTGGRSLSLLVALDQYWQSNPGLQGQYNVVWCCEPGKTVLLKISALIEYLSDKCKRDFNQKNNFNLFDMKHVKNVTCIEHLDYFSEPKVVLATSDDLAAGFAKQLFMEWAPQAKNRIIFTSRGKPGSLQHELLTRHSSQGPHSVSVDFYSKQLLEGEALEAFNRARDAKMAAETAEAAKEMQMDVDEQGEAELDTLEVEGLTEAMEQKDSGKSSQARWSWEQPSNVFLKFPFQRLNPQWNEYGVELGEDIFSEAEEKFGTQAVREVMTVGGEEEQDSSPNGSQKPFRVLKGTKEVAVAAAIDYVDFEGRTDKQSLLKILTSQIQPKQLLLVRGSSAVRDEVQRGCRKARAKIRSFVPEKSQKLELSSDVSMYRVLMSNAVFSKAQWQNCGDYEVGFVSGVLAPMSGGSNTTNSSQWELVPEPSTAQALQDAEEEDDMAAVTAAAKSSYKAVGLAPALQAATFRPLYRVGRVQLSDFKQLLDKAHIRAEFRSGKLVVGDEGMIVLQQSKKKKGQITMDGVPSALFFQVRDMLYQQYCIV